MNLRLTARFDLACILLLLLPLLVINVHLSHDWGDDFAQYIHQAKLLTEGKAQTHTGYIFNHQFPTVGPPVYPVGFPLLLAPVYAVFGNNLQAFIYFQTLLLIAACLIVYLFLKRFVHPLYATLAVLLVAYNPWMIAFKNEILSDIAFLLACTLSLWLYHRTEQKGFPLKECLLLGFVTAFTVLIRNIGILFIPVFWSSWLLMRLRERPTDRNFFNQAIHLMVLTAIALLMPFMVNRITGAPTSGTFSYFTSLYTFNGLKETFINTSDFYYEQFSQFLQVDQYHWQFLSRLTASIGIGLMCIGFIIRSIKGLRAPDLFVIGYLIIVLAFANTTQGFRYLLPIIPIAYLYLFTALSSIRIRPNKITKPVLTAIILILLAVQYFPAVNRVSKQSNRLKKGPQEPESVEAFSYIQQHTPADAVIIFQKPRALALYSQRAALAVHPTETVEQIHKKVLLHQIDYLLTVTEYNNQSVNAYIEQNPEQVKRTWSNQRYTLYQIGL